MGKAGVGVKTGKVHLYAGIYGRIKPDVMFKADWVAANAPQVRTLVSNVAHVIARRASADLAINHRDTGESHVRHARGRSTDYYAVLEASDALYVEGKTGVMRNAAAAFGGEVFNPDSPSRAKAKRNRKSSNRRRRSSKRRRR